MSRTNVDLDNRLVNQALSLTHLRTKKAVLHFALQELIKKFKRQDIVKFMGTNIWHGNLESLRGARS